MLLPAPPSRARAARAAAAALAVAAAAAPATPANAAARPSTITPAAVRATVATAQPGAALPVRITLNATGSVRTATGIAVYLSKDGKRSKDDTRLLTTVKTPKTKAKGRTTLVVTARLPASQALGVTRVIACIGETTKRGSTKPAKDCRAAKAPVNVVATVAAAATPAALIAADLAAGRLKADQALAYRVFAVFGDDRLPAKYAGGAGVGTAAEGDDGVMRELASAWGSISPALKKQVRKYFLPPALRDATTAELKAGGAKRRKADKGTKQATRAQAPAADDFVEEPDPGDAGEEEPALDESVCDTEYFKPKSWNSLSAAGGKIRIAWRTNRPEDGKDAKAMAADLTTAYAKYKALLGREPLSDATVDCYHGPDGALDVYIDRVTSKSALTVPSIQATGMQADCEGYPGFIVTNPTDATLSMRFILAHELFHAFQMSYSYESGCADYAWFDEGSANWAAHSVFPTDDSEHLWDTSLLAPNSDIADEYYSWVFNLWMEQTRGAASIRRTLERFESQPSAIKAVDGAIGTWRKSYLDFAKHGWNQAPFPSFQQWDRLATKPRDVPESNLFLAGQKTRTAYAEFSLGQRARTYKRFPLTDDKIRELTFKNTLADQPDARIGAILTLAGGGQRWEDWSEKESVRFCRDEPDQNVTEIVLVYANAKLTPKFESDGWITGTPELALRDTCETLPWHFKIQSATLTTHLDGSYPAGASQACPSDGFLIRDQVTFTAAAGAQGFDPEKNVVKQRNARSDLLDGRFQAKAPDATWNHTLTGCKYPFQPEVQKCGATRTEHATGDWTLGFSLQAESKKAKTATLTWYVGPIIGGYFDADDSVCNVTSIDQIIEDDTLVESQVSLEQLQSTKPFTLTLQGKTSWDRDSRGKQFSLTYDWDYAITLQRVNPDGSPLS